MRHVLLLASLVFGLAVLGSAFTASASADTVGPITFEPPDATPPATSTASTGWTKSGPYDVAVSDVSTFPAASEYGFGAQALRLSDAVTSGSFSDQTLSPAK